MKQPIYPSFSKSCPLKAEKAPNPGDGRALFSLFPDHLRSSRFLHFGQRLRQRPIGRRDQWLFLVVMGTSGIPFIPSLWLILLHTCQSQIFYTCQINFSSLNKQKTLQPDDDPSACKVWDGSV
jgi:hypothetical protein